MKNLILVGLLLTSAFAMAEVIATGEEARINYEAMSGLPETGPFCTGACFPGQPCDPACYTTRTAQTYSCTKSAHTSGRVEYECNSKDSND